MSRTSNFDLTPISGLSGSYVDSIMTGFMVQKLINRTMSLTSSIPYVTGNRFEIGSNVSGAFRGYLGQATEYGEFNNIASASFRPEKHAGLRFIDLIDQSKIFYDSIPPSFDECMKKIGKGMILLNLASETNTQPLSFVYLLSQAGYPITGSTDGTVLSDTYWLSSFPFSNLYAGSRRIRSSEQFLQYDRLLYNASCSFLPADYPGALVVAGYNTTPKSTGQFSYTATNEDLFWAGSGDYAAPRFVTIGYSFNGTVPNDNSVASFYDSKYVHLLNGNSGSVNSAGAFTGFYSSFPEPVTAETNRPVTPRQEDLIKHAFGFGEGIDRSVHGVAFSAPRSSSFFEVDRPVKLKYGSVVRGWRYGLYSGFEASPKAVYRRDCFGQFRDRLEQRLFTKFLDLNTNSTTMPLFMSFLSGTQAFMTASSPSTLNTRESGIYSNTYSPGKPFTDI